jgi:hypothetical protein
MRISVLRGSKLRPSWLRLLGEYYMSLAFVLASWFEAPAPASILYSRLCLVLVCPNIIYKHLFASYLME